MPLLPGYSRVTISENIRELRKGNKHSAAEASAIAFKKAREYWEAYGPKGQPMPKHLRR